MDDINVGGGHQIQLGYESISGDETNEINAIQSKQQVARRNRRARLDKQRQHRLFTSLLQSNNFPHELPRNHELYIDTAEEESHLQLQQNYITPLPLLPPIILLPPTYRKNSPNVLSLRESMVRNNVSLSMPFSNDAATNDRFWNNVLNMQSIDGRIGYETTNQYIGRLILESSDNLPFGFFDSPKNAQQRIFLDVVLDRLRSDFVAMSKEEGSGVQFPLEGGSIQDLPPLRQPKNSGGGGQHRSGGGRIYCAVVERLLSSGSLVDEVDEVVVEDSKIGSTWIKNEEKEKLYNEKKDVVSTVLKHIYSIEEQSMESQRNSRDRFDATNKFIVGDTIISKDTTLGEALDMEREGISFLSLVLRHYCIDKNGSLVYSLVSKTFLKDMESGAQLLGEELGLFPRNHKSHSHETSRGSLGPIFPAEAEVFREECNLLATYNPDQQQRIGTEIHQPGSCSSWSPDLKHPRYGLLQILMRMILHHPNPFDQTDCNGQPLCINAFLDKHPILKEQLKRSGLTLASLYDASCFIRADQGDAMVEITVRILCNMIYGGWEYMDTNAAALEFLGGISMIDYLIMFGYSRRYDLSFGDVAMTIDMKDGNFHEIIVHTPPSYQNSIQGGAGRLEERRLNGMWRSAMSNRFRSRWTKMLSTSSETPHLVDTVESLLKEPVRGNNLIMGLLYYHAVKNFGMNIMEASRIAKAFMVTEEDLLSPTFNPKLMSSITNLIGSSQRKKDMSRKVTQLMELSANNQIKLNAEEQKLVDQRMKDYQQSKDRAEKSDKRAWTRAEDKTLHDAQSRLGNKWVQISSLLPGRSHTDVKTRWKNFLCRLPKEQLVAWVDLTTEFDVSTLAVAEPSLKRRKKNGDDNVRETQSHTWQARIYYSGKQESIGTFDSWWHLMRACQHLPIHPHCREKMMKAY